MNEAEKVRTTEREEGRKPARSGFARFGKAFIEGLAVAGLVTKLAACSYEVPPLDAIPDAGSDITRDQDSGENPDASNPDSGPDVMDAGHDAGEDAGHDGGPTDAGMDAGPADAGMDAGPLDAGPMDAGMDAGLDAGLDAGPPDSGLDSGLPDSGSPDAGIVCASATTGNFGGSSRALEISQ